MVAAIDAFTTDPPEPSEPPRSRRRRAGSRLVRSEREEGDDVEGDLELGRLLLDDGVVARRRPLVADDDGAHETLFDDAAAEDTRRMSRRRSAKKTRPAKPPQFTGPVSLPAEILGVALFAVAVLLLLSLLSYASNDAAFAMGVPRPIRNWIGPGGALVADALTLLFGLCSFGVPFVVVVLAVACFRPRPLPLLGLRVGGAVLTLVGGMSLLHLIFRGSDLLPYPAGGLVGAVTAEHSSHVLAPLGTGVVSLAVIFVGGIIALNRPLGPTTMSLAEWLRSLWLRLVDRVRVLAEERRLLRDDKERLLEELTARDEQQAVAHAARSVQRTAAVKETAKARATQKLVKSLLADPDGASDREGDDSDAPPVVVDPMRRRKPGPGDQLALAPDVLSPSRAIDDDMPPVRVIDDRKRPTVEPLVEAREASWRPPWSSGAGPATSEPLNETTIDAAPIGAVSNPPRLSPPLPGLDAYLDEDSISQSTGIDEGALKIVKRSHADVATIMAAADEAIEPPPKTQWALPPLNLLDYDAPKLEPLDEAHMHMQATKLIAKFKDFGIEGRVREIRPGPVVTTYEFVPAPGIKVSRIAALSDDIAMAMEAIQVRIVAPIPGKGAVGIESPNEKRETVFLKEIVNDPAFRKRDDKLLMALGKDIEGKPYYANLAEMPHLLIAGTTGSGKSVSVNAMICSVLCRATPDDVRFLMIDPKMLELSIYEGIPHLLLPPIIDSKKAALALKWAVAEMERRYQIMSELGVRDIVGFNVRQLDAKEGRDPEARRKLLDPNGRVVEKMPLIVIVVDEYADLLAVAGKDVEGYVMRLAQKARACGIHVMLATQRPSVDVITGLIKANFPVRMGFRLASSHDSKTIINRPGAEKLLGRGDMLFMPPGTSAVQRVHGAFISEKELHRVVEFLRAQGTPHYDMSILTMPADDDGDGGGALDEEKDVRYDEATAVVARTRKCSTSWLQRQLGIGYNRSARIVERMEREGLVGPVQNAKGDREIFIDA